ncbi:hypothetical protein GGR54DRAFT_638300 [Hypoxylon sp. NC1633]|nr:hypothetical protein GGR54DRAFT_638300 [Hypoxylon sp. NC1633]
MASAKGNPFHYPQTRTTLAKRHRDNKDIGRYITEAIEQEERHIARFTAAKRACTDSTRRQPSRQPTRRSARRPFPRSARQSRGWNAQRTTGVLQQARITQSVRPVQEFSYHDGPEFHGPRRRREQFLSEHGSKLNTSSKSSNSHKHTRVSEAVVDELRSRRALMKATAVRRSMPRTIRARRDVITSVRNAFRSARAPPIYTARNLNPAPVFKPIDWNSGASSDYGDELVPPHAT